MESLRGGRMIFDHWVKTKKGTPLSEREFIPLLIHGIESQRENSTESMDPVEFQTVS